MNDAPYQEMYAVRGSGGDSGSNGAEPWRTQPIDHDALLLTSWFIYIYIYLVLSTPNLSGDAEVHAWLAEKTHTRNGRRPREARTLLRQRAPGTAKTPEAGRRRCVSPWWRATAPSQARPCRGSSGRSVPAAGVNAGRVRKAGKLRRQRGRTLGRFICTCPS